MKLSRILPLVVGTAAAGILASSASPAQALVFNVGGTNYDVTTVTGTYNDLATTLQSQVWWGNSALAQQFAQTVNIQLGLPNISEASPFFAYGETSGEPNIWYFSDEILQTQLQAGTEWTYATATPDASVPFDIPGGATMPTVGSLFALALMRKVKKSIASKTHIANPVTTTVG
ncbi:hypothetical protein [Anabaena azotica]|uniref:hypothetical protein n=1 Tax=Anabaena azotica TaxID=197653 RepID=UPI0039A74586